MSVAQLINIGFKVEFMHGKERLLDDKGKLIGLGKQTKGNLFYLISRVLLLKQKKVGYGTKDYVL